MNDYSEKQLKCILEKVKKMTVEDYEKLYNKCEDKENINVIFIDWGKFFKDKKIYLKRFISKDSTCFGCYIFEKELHGPICERLNCIDKQHNYICKRAIPIGRYLL